jgi:hypothetical protein
VAYGCETVADTDGRKPLRKSIDAGIESVAPHPRQSKISQSLVRRPGVIDGEPEQTGHDNGGVRGGSWVIADRNFRQNLTTVQNRTPSLAWALPMSTNAEAAIQ